MSTALITNSIIAKLKPQAKQYEVRDTRLKGLMVRVHPSGNMSYALQYARGCKVTLGKVSVLTPSQAREKAIKVLAEYANGLDPKEAKARRKGVPTMKAFLHEKYERWLITHNASGDEDIKTLKRHFNFLFDKRLDEIKTQELDKWRAKKLETQAMKPNTLNRTLTPLRSMLTKAVEWGMISENGLAGLKVLKYDDSRIRYLSDAEKENLFNALNAREDKLKKGRYSANEWRKQRGKVLYPEMLDHHFADHLQPMIILTLNTGVRKSELFRLKRADINLKQATLFIKQSKNYLSRYLPLNQTVLTMLKVWLEQTKDLNSPYLFPSPATPQKPISTIKTTWTTLRDQAKLDNFHWHDLRHDFASQLVMKGVSLYAVQKLLGHKKIDQTMKYAHLAPEFIAESVRRLD